MKGILFTYNTMPFWDIFKKPAAPIHKNPTEPTVVIMQSDSLGMTVIQEDGGQSGPMKQLSVQQWIDIIQTKDLKGFPFERIYFSFLKGIPQFLRMKIWLLLCSVNNAKNFAYSSKKDVQKRGSFSKVDQLTVKVYERLCEGEPVEKQAEQIQKDLKRSFSPQKLKYKYLLPLLRKMLYASSNSGIQYTQGMNYILLNILIYCLQSIGVTEQNIEGLLTSYQRDIFVIYRETIIRMEQVFGHNQIFKVMKELEQKITQSVPQILFLIYKYGLDCFSSFSQMYYSVMSYNDPPEQLCKQMLDLFFLTGEKAIHATIIRMLEVTKPIIMKINDTESLQRFLKEDIYTQYYKTFIVERQTAKCIQDFKLCFFDSIERIKM